jgi:hypothetical protein
VRCGECLLLWEEEYIILRSPFRTRDQPSSVARRQLSVRGARVAAEAKYGVAEPFWAGKDPAGRFQASFSLAILRLPCAKFAPVAAGHDYASGTGIFQAI